MRHIDDYLQICHYLHYLILIVHIMKIEDNITEDYRKRIKNNPAMASKKKGGTGKVGSSSNSNAKKSKASIDMVDLANRLLEPVCSHLDRLVDKKMENVADMCAEVRHTIFFVRMISRLVLSFQHKMIHFLVV